MSRRDAAGRFLAAPSPVPGVGGTLGAVAAGLLVAVLAAGLMWALVASR